ncbi:T9SS type A sorting domain-containing protein, partial [bacterium]|nr:T9SS type A sorting domain-containing protein [bacterium]
SMTNIRYSVAHRTRVQLRIYNILGQEVAVLEDRLREPGIYTLHWQPENIASGLYIVSMKADAFVRNRRMLFIK